MPEITFKWRDPPEVSEENKKLIKKKVRDELNKNSKLSTILTENKVKGKFIKNFTECLIKKQKESILCGYDYYLENDIKDTINSERVIDRAFTWRSTPQGYKYWNNIHNTVKINLTTI